MARTFQPPPVYQRRVYTPPDYLRPSAPAGSRPVAPGAHREPVVIPPKPTIDQIPVRAYSRLTVHQFILHKLVPQREMPIADVDHMDWDFEEPRDDDDNEVRVNVSISADEIAIIKRYGYHHDPIEKQVPLFEDIDLEKLQEAQEQELQAAHPTMRGNLRLEHKQQLEWAQEQKYDLTIIDYLASPFRRQCADRFQATMAEREMNTRLSGFKKKLDAHRG